MSKVFSVLGIIAGAVLIILSFFIEVPNVAASNIKVPSREINNPTRYIGGDAYKNQYRSVFTWRRNRGSFGSKSDIRSRVFYWQNGNKGNLFCRRRYFIIWFIYRVRTVY